MLALGGGVRRHAGRDRARRDARTSTIAPSGTRATRARRRTSAARPCSAASSWPPRCWAASSRACRRSSPARARSGRSARSTTGAALPPGPAWPRSAWPRSSCGARVSAGTCLPGDAADLALTVVWVVGLVNAFNLIDNMDGAAATLAAVTSAAVGALALIEGDVALAVLTLRTGRGVPRLPALQPRLARAHLPRRRRQPADRLRGGREHHGAADRRPSSASSTSSPRFCSPASRSSTPLS